ncbi:hypothetical protein GPECTOR_1448g640 [Gonium pectorale]|uniref:Uncharacterized protein n=1 Tax=Gonium pectorale TaxID=33097 RepID=A0A150FTE7_GONPE|nr:hypothetical protein GPECTOR_1448g640 [Gonium pectorale]|eukprot:KXZ40897.1 hypothetical protein GPECTOR_1448g640 [Gonium pectorale]
MCSSASSAAANIGQHLETAEHRAAVADRTAFYLSYPESWPRALPRPPVGAYCTAYLISPAEMISLVDTTTIASSITASRVQPRDDDDDASCADDGDAGRPHGSGRSGLFHRHSGGGAAGSGSFGQGGLGGGGAMPPPPHANFGTRPGGPAPAPAGPGAVTPTGPNALAGGFTGAAGVYGPPRLTPPPPQLPPPQQHQGTATGDVYDEVSRCWLCCPCCGEKHAVWGCCMPSCPHIGIRGVGAGVGSDGRSLWRFTCPLHPAEYDYVVRGVPNR